MDRIDRGRLASRLEEETGTAWRGASCSWGPGAEADVDAHTAAFAGILQHLCTPAHA